VQTCLGSPGRSAEQTIANHPDRSPALRTKGGGWTGFQARPSLALVAIMRNRTCNRRAERGTETINRASTIGICGRNQPLGSA
jgi:hypothetical protein